MRLTPPQRVKQEINQYLMHPQLNIEDDPLPWWQSECVRYPILAKLARNIYVFVSPTFWLKEYLVVVVTLSLINVP